jgi:serine/threonine-protein kinase HipA
MSEALNVYLDGVRIGTLSQARQGSLGFVYDDDYLGLPDPTPLSLSIPLHAGAHANRAVRAFLEGLLPDNQAVRERWGATYGVSPNNPFGLLRHVGRDAAGAVQILSAEEASTDAATRFGDIDWMTDEQFVTLVRDIAEHRTDWNPGRYAGRWSLAGAQSKVALYRDGMSGAWGIPKDSTPTTHIIKPALDGFDDHHINEALCQRAASRLGLPAAASELIEFGDVRAIVSTRYDRTRDDAGRLHRLHQEDLCQALSINPTRKYQADGGPGVGEIADLFTRLGVADRQASAQRFFDAVAYNVLIGGTDAHAKNYSLLLRGGRAQLAPLYDLASAVAFPTDRPLESSMKVGDHRAMREISPSDWAKAGRRLGVGADAALARVPELRDALPGALEFAVESLPADTRDRAQRLGDQICDHATSLPRQWS